MQHIYSTYTHQDWLNGKIFYHNHKLCLDLFHGLRGAELHKHRAETQYQELTEEVAPQEKGKILTDQFKFYHERVASHISSAKRNFFSLCAHDKDKLQKVIEEIERFEKIFYAEKLPDVKPDQQYDFGRFKLDGSKILALRSVLNAVSGHKTYDLSGMNSPQCRFHFPSNTNNYIDADHYFKYLVWLRSVKDELEKRKCPAPNQNVMQVFSFFDSYIGLNTTSVLITHELKKIMTVELEIEALERGYTNYHEGNHQLSLWAFGFFKKEADKIISHVKVNTIQCDNTDKIKAYVGQVYSFTKGLLEKNKEFISEFTFGEEDKMMRIYLDLALNTVKDSLERDYELYLEDSDAKKITIQSFVHCVLHEFDDCNKNVHVKIHKPDCKSPEKSLERLDKYKRKKLREFENRYQMIVLNWINYNCEMGNCFNEKHFIRFASGYLGKMFSFDEEKNVWYVADRHHERFEFHPDFYKQQVVPFCDFFKMFFDMRREEISDLPEEHEHSPEKTDAGKNKKIPVEVNTFTYFDFAKNSSAVTSLHTDMKEKFIDGKTPVKDFKSIFDNKHPDAKIPWIEGKGALRYFVRQLKQKKKVSTKEIWIAANNSFIIASEPDFNITELTHGKDTENKALIKQIDTLINGL
jgi:hypothetical protein